MNVFAKTPRFPLRAATGILSLLAGLLLASPANAEAPGAPDLMEGSGGGAYTPPTDEMTPEQHRQIRQDLQNTIEALQADGRLPPPGQPGEDRAAAAGSTLLAWPLRLGKGRSDFDYHGLSAFVDQNAAYPDQLRDFNCGKRTYDTASGYNHQGTDIFTWPFAWNKMDDEDVVIAAGAPGVIIGKDDGNDDRSCAMSNKPWNAVYVRHADGTVAWYGHMKKGSPTIKTVGDPVALGEYLGVVGSSGSSTGPHLHLELHNSAGTLIDPWDGSCNAMQREIGWQNQRAYYDTSINAITVGTAPPDLPDCTVGTSNASDHLSGGSRAYFTVYARDQRDSTPIALKIYKPDGTLWSQSTSGVPASGSFYTVAYWYWWWTLPVSPSGQWRVEASVGGKSFSKHFYLNTPAAFGAPTQIALASGSVQTQSTAPGAAFAKPVAVRVADAQNVPVKGALVQFDLPTAGASAILESRNALSDENGIASVLATANRQPGAYTLTARLRGTAAGFAFNLQNTPTGNTFSLSVAKTGSGTVVSTPAGIDCGSACTANFAANGSVSLTATAAAQSRFNGWSGACSGSGVCNVSMSSAQSVRAEFIDGGVPAAPQITAITPGPGRLGILFSAPADPGNSPISGYTATCSAQGQTTRSASGSSSPLVVRNLAGNVTYTCSLTARNNEGSSSASSSIAATPQPGRKTVVAPLNLLFD